MAFLNWMGHQPLTSGGSPLGYEPEEEEKEEA